MATFRKGIRFHSSRDQVPGRKRTGLAAEAQNADVDGSYSANRQLLVQVTAVQSTSASTAAGLLTAQQSLADTQAFINAHLLNVTDGTTSVDQVISIHAGKVVDNGGGSVTISQPIIQVTALPAASDANRGTQYLLLSDGSTTDDHLYLSVKSHTGANSMRLIS